MRRVPLVTALALLAAMLAPMPAAFAHGHGGHGGHGHGGHAHGGGFHGGFHGGGGFHHHHHAVIAGGIAWPSAYPYYYPYYYGYPGTWTYVVPSPLYAAPLAGDCRTFQGDALIAGTNQPFYGSACLQPDGQWHNVQ